MVLLMSDTWETLVSRFLKMFIKNTIVDDASTPYQLIKINVNNKDNQLPLHKVSNFFLNDWNRSQTHNHFVHKWTLDHYAIEASVTSREFLNLPVTFRVMFHWIQLCDMANKTLSNFVLWGHKISWL